MVGWYLEDKLRIYRIILVCVGLSAVGVWKIL